MLTFLTIIAVSLFWTAAVLWSDHRHRQAMREAEERAVLWEVRAVRLNFERAQAVRWDEGYEAAGRQLLGQAASPPEVEHRRNPYRIAPPALGATEDQP